MFTNKKYIYEDKAAFSAMHTQCNVQSGILYFVKNAIKNKEKNKRNKAKQANDAPMGILNTSNALTVRVRCKNK